jgi:hypothetical protein
MYRLFHAKNLLCYLYEGTFSEVMQFLQALNIELEDDFSDYYVEFPGD